MLFKNINYCDENFEQKKGFIALKGKYIDYIGTTEPEEDYGEEINGENKFLIPGLVNPHCHVPMTLLRGYGEGLPLDRWLNERVYPFEDKLTDEDVYWGSLLGIGEMLAGGVTSFSDMYFFCDSICSAVEVSGIKSNVSRGLTVFDGSPFYGSYRHKESEHLVDRWNGACEGRIMAEASVHAEHTTNEKFVREVVEFAKDKNVGMHIHLSETAEEHKDCLSRRGCTPTEYFLETGLLDLRVTAAHGVHITKKDMSILAENGAGIVHCPSSNLKLGSGVAPVPAMIEKGINVAIGTDGASSNNNLNMIEEMHLTALIHNGIAMDASLLTAGQVIKMASRNGAAMQGRTDTGIIAKGMRADLAVIDMNKPHLQPVHDMLANTIYSAQASDICMTIVDGRVVYRDGRVLTFDLEQAAAMASKAAERIAGCL